MKITGEEYLWDCIKENTTNIWVTLLLPWMENVLENTCSWSCWICCFGFVLEKGQNKATLTLKSRTWWDSCCCTLPRGDYSIIFSMHKLHLIKLSPTWPQLLKTVITPLSSPIKIIFSNHSSTLATHLGLEDKGWDSENSGRGETGCNKLCCWGDAAPTLLLQVELPKYNGFCITNHEFQAVCYEYMKSRSGCSVVEQDKGIFARFEPRYLYIHRCCRVSSQGQHKQGEHAYFHQLFRLFWQREFSSKLQTSSKKSLQDTIWLAWSDFRQLLFPPPWAAFI